MLSTILIATVLGIFAGAAPGPYTTMVAATGLERGFRPALRLALAPLVTDVPPLVLTALVLERLNPLALTLLGISGGVLLAMLGVRFVRRHAFAQASHLEAGSVTFWHVSLTGLTSPAPWLFWLIVGSPLMLRSWGRSWTEGVAFVAIIFLTNMTTASSLAWAASHGRNVLDPRWLGRALTTMGAALILAGTLLVWQAMEGNFQSWIDNQTMIRRVLEDS